VTETLGRNRWRLVPVDVIEEGEQLASTLLLVAQQPRLAVMFLYSWILDGGLENAECASCEADDGKILGERGTFERERRKQGMEDKELEEGALGHPTLFVLGHCPVQ